MALHELATNAVKYGALSTPGGRVTVSWNTMEGDGPAEDDTAGADAIATGSRIHFMWREEGGPPVAEPAERGFGSMLIERSLAVEMQAEVALRFEPEGLVCAIEARLPEVIGKEAPDLSIYAADSPGKPPPTGAGPAQ